MHFDIWGDAHIEVKPTQRSKYCTCHLLFASRQLTNPSVIETRSKVIPLPYPKPVLIISYLYDGIYSTIKLLIDLPRVDFIAIHA